MLSISGNVLIDNIFTVGDTDVHYFRLWPQDLAAAGGQYVVTLAVSGGTGGFQPQARLQAPTGGWLGNIISAGSSRTVNLDLAGQYAVWVQDDDNRDTGTYALALEGIHPPSLDAREIVPGDVKDGRLNVLAQVDAYTFTATADEIVTLSLSKTHTGSRATLYSSAGDKVKLYSSTTGYRVSQLTAGSKVLTEPLDAGDYVIQVHDNIYRATGDYHVTLEGLVPPSADAVMLTLGETATGEIAAGEIDSYKFMANGGEIVTVSLSDVLGGLTTRLWAELYSPSGKQVSKLPDTNGPSEVENGKKVIYRLPDEAGSYVIQVYDDDYTHSEPYGVTLAGVNPPSLNAVEIAIGQTVTGTLDMRSEVGTYYFTLSAEDLALTGGEYQTMLSLASDTTVDYKPRARMFAPTGATVGQELNAGNTKLMTLSSPGTYVIQVYDDNYTHTKEELLDRGKAPEYTVWFQDAQPPAVQSVTVSAPLLTDADVGPGRFSVTVRFNESMDPSILPTLFYSHLAVLGGQSPTLSNPSAVWSTSAVVNDTVTITYDVADHELYAPDIAIQVWGAADVAGNFQFSYQTLPLFGIDTQNPWISLLTPRHNASGVSLDAGLVMVFQETVERGSGSIVIRRFSDGSTVETIPADSPQVNVAEEVVTVVPGQPFLESTTYYVEVSQGAFRDQVGNDFAGFNGSGAWRFSTVDLTPPSVLSLWPPDGAVDVAWDTELRMVFDEPVRLGLGEITIRASVDDALVEAISVLGGQITVSGNTVTIQPSITLADATSYYVEVPGGAMEDLAGNGFPGISGPAAWTFTARNAPPGTLLLSPPVGATGVVLSASLELTFDQTVRAGEGEIVLKRSNDDSAFQTIPVEDERVTVSGTRVTIQPSPMLERRMVYYVQITAGAFEDLSGNPFGGFSGSEHWNFATVGPLVSDDFVTTWRSTPREIDVLSNDSGMGRPVAPESLVIVSGPSHGTAVVADGAVLYSPAANYAGEDTFQYTVHDVVGFKSNVGTVNVTVVAGSAFQNPELREDVDASGAVTPLDVLICINRINSHGSQLPPAPIPPAVPLYYYDVDGNSLLEPLDVLLIINYLNNASSAGEGEAGHEVEPFEPAVLAASAPPPRWLVLSGAADHGGGRWPARLSDAETVLAQRPQALSNRPWTNQPLPVRPQRHDAVFATGQSSDADWHDTTVDELLPVIAADIAHLSA